MSRILTLWRYSIGKKIVMAVTGIILLGFVIGHLLGNLKIFLGAEEFNHYAAGLRTLGAPFLPPEAGLWLARIGLLVAVALHVVAALQLRAMSAEARPTAYKLKREINFSPLSRAMFWGGVALGAYILLHLAHLTIGCLHPDFREDLVVGSRHYANAYHNVVAGFQVWWVAVLYMLAMIPLGLHLYHGLWSACQTLGINHPQINHLRRPVAAAVAIVVALGYCLVPLAVLTGWVSF